MFLEKGDYIRDLWNYGELAGIFLYLAASALDIKNDRVTDSTRILYVLSIMFSLYKIMFLIRTFRQFSFLVQMVITVMKALKWFLCLFFIFVLYFAQCYQILNVDISCYGRIPSIFAHMFATLRASLGDNALIDPYQSFDMYELDGDEKKYKHSLWIVHTTIVVFLFSTLFLFAMFLNFIIAVIGNAFNEVSAN